MELTKEMLQAAVEKAVQIGLLPRHAEQSQYIRHYSMIETIIKAALKVTEKPKETKEELNKRLLDYMKTPETKKMIDSIAEQILNFEYPGLKYTYDFNIQGLKLTIKTDHVDPESLRREFIKRIPMGISVEVNKL